MDFDGISPPKFNYRKTFLTLIIKIKQKNLIRDKNDRRVESYIGIEK